VYRDLITLSTKVECYERESNEMIPSIYVGQNLPMVPVASSGDRQLITLGATHPKIQHKVSPNLFLSNLMIFKVTNDTKERLVYQEDRPVFLTKMGDYGQHAVFRLTPNRTLNRLAGICT